MEKRRWNREEGREKTEQRRRIIGKMKQRRSNREDEQRRWNREDWQEKMEQKIWNREDEIEKMEQTGWNRGIEMMEVRV